MRLRATVVMVAIFVLSPWPHSDEGGVTKHKEPEFKLFPVNKIVWKNGPASLPKGAQIAVLEGDPTKQGPFVFRLKVPDGYRIPLHTHPKRERVTVISGTFNIGMGEKFDEKAFHAMLSRSPVETLHAPFRAVPSG